MTESEAEISPQWFINYPPLGLRLGIAVESGKRFQDVVILRYDEGDWAEELRMPLSLVLKLSKLPLHEAVPVGTIGRGREV